MKNYKVYIFNDCNQPINGWFKSCFVCKTITAQTYFFNEKKYFDKYFKYIVYVCPECKKNILKNNTIRDLYEKKVRDYINNIDNKKI